MLIYDTHLEFVQKHNPALVKKIHEPLIDNISSRLILANHSLQQLNILDNRQHKGQCSSILTFTNQCKTSMGKRAFNSIILHPSTDSDYLNTEYAIIDHMIQHFDDFHKQFEHVQTCSSVRIRWILKIKLAENEARHASLIFRM